jgi:hypothetical protein
VRSPPRTITRASNTCTVADTGGRDACRQGGAVVLLVLATVVCLFLGLHLGLLAGGHVGLRLLGGAHGEGKGGNKKMVPTLTPTKIDQPPAKGGYPTSTKCQ